jgi:hypothetical protein
LLPFDIRSANLCRNRKTSAVSAAVGQAEFDSVMKSEKRNPKDFGVEPKYARNKASVQTPTAANLQESRGGRTPFPARIATYPAFSIRNVPFTGGRSVFGSYFHGPPN